ncbi:MAG: hypothetical protein QXK37_02220 [Candidatus Woesearchaeota archaeon]
MVINMRKGELSINIIIIAAIALLVLVIVSVIFMGRMGLFNWKSTDCATVNGVCMVQRACLDGQATCCGENYIKHPVAVCYDPYTKKKDPNMLCCVPESNQQ